MLKRSSAAAIFAAQLLLPMCAIAQEAPFGVSPLVGTLNMPLVSPAQAERYLAERDVPSSNVASIPMESTERSSDQPPVAINIAPVLRHDLPTSATTQWGLPRAAFAIGKPGSEAEKKRNRDAAVGAGPTSGPTRSPIRDAPPGIKPK